MFSVLVKMAGYNCKIERRGGLISGSSGAGLSPGQPRHCIEFSGKTLSSPHCLSLSRCINRYSELNAGGNPAMD